MIRWRAETKALVQLLILHRWLVVDITFIIGEIPEAVPKAIDDRAVLAVVQQFEEITFAIVEQTGMPVGHVLTCLFLVELLQANVIGHRGTEPDDMLANVDHVSRTTMDESRV